MKPLRDQLDDADIVVRAGAALLAKVPPLEMSSEQRRRIRARIDAASEQSYGVRWLRPAFAIPVLLVVGVAGATVGPRLYHTAMPKSTVELEPHHAPAEAAPPIAHPPQAPQAEAPKSEEPSIRPEDLEIEKSIPAPRASQSGPGSTLMMEALQARRAGDTARAQELTAEYQKKYPNGALKEEAAAISFESAASRKDPNAAKLAQRYLSSFPQGRFRAQAQQVLNSAH
jgi:hypothetical protein